MNLIDMSIEERGFTPTSIALSLRTIGACYAARHGPDSRLLTGIGALTVAVDANGHYLFDAEARCLADGETVATLLDWLEARLCEQSAIISWHNWGSVPRRLALLANMARHPQLTTASADTTGRWRDMPRGHTWHLRQARAQAMPCLCLPATPLDQCQAATPAALLPHPNTAAGELIQEAVGGWQVWARSFSDFAAADNRADKALRALDTWRAQQSPAN